MYYIFIILLNVNKHICLYFFDKIVHFHLMTSCDRLFAAKFHIHSYTLIVVQIIEGSYNRDSGKRESTV